MASEDGNEGKDFVLEQKQKEQFERAVMETVKNLKHKNFFYNDFMYDVVRNEEDNSIEIKVSSTTTVAVIREGKFEYNISNLEDFRNVLNSKNNSTGMDYNSLGLPDLEYLKYLEKEQKENSKKIDEKEREDKGKERNREDSNEEQDEEEEEITLNTDENNNQLDDNKKLTKKSSWVQINTNVEIVEGKTIKDLLKINSDKLYIAPTKDYSTFKVVEEVGYKQYKEVEGLEQTEGNNPSQAINTLDPENKMNSTKRQSNMMLKIKGKNNQGIAIAREGMGDILVTYWRKAYDDKYMSTIVPISGQDGEYDHISKETKEYMSERYISDRELDEMCENAQTLEDVGKREIPDEIDPTEDGIQFEELDIVNFKEKMKQQILKKLNYENYGYPDAREHLANDMTNLIVDEGMDYEQSKAEIERTSKESGGRTPGDREDREEIN